MTPWNRKPNTRNEEEQQQQRQKTAQNIDNNSTTKHWKIHNINTMSYS
jgi:hypothetical protein